MAVVKYTRFAKKVLGIDLTRGQKALALVAFDGHMTPELEFADRRLAESIFGGCIRELPPAARDVLVLRLGRWSGKSTISASYLIYRMLTADVSQAQHGDIPGAYVIGPTKEDAQETLAKALDLVNGCFLKNLLVRKPTATGFLLRRPDNGRIVRFVSIVRSPRGRKARGRSIIDAIVDESEFIAPSDPAKMIRDTDIIEAMFPRLMPGGRIILASTPWPAESATATFFDDNYGEPKTALAAMATTLVMRDGDPTVVQKRENDMLRNASNALREYDCILSDTPTSFFEFDSIDRACVDSMPVTGRMVSVGLDAGFVQDGFGYVAVERQEKLRAVGVEFLMPKPGEPLVPNVTFGVLMARARASGAKDVYADGTYIEVAREHASANGMQLARGPTSQSDQATAYVYLRDLFRNNLIEIPRNSPMAKQLKSVMALPVSGGKLKFVLPKNTGQLHADLVPALLAAVDADRRKHGSLLVTERVVPRTLPGAYGGMVSSARRRGGGGRPAGGL